MKKLIISVAILFVAGSAFAQSVKGKSVLSPYADLGLALPSGTVSTGYDAGTKFAYGFGADFGYGVTDTGMILIGLAYEYRPIPLTYDNYTEGKGDLLIKQSFITCNLAWRFLFNSFYGDLGMFYGIRIGTSKWEYTGDSTGSGNLSDADGVTEKNPFGLIFGFGYLAKISDQVSIDLGAKLKRALTNQYEDTDGWKLKTSTLSFKIGLNYSL